MARRIVLLCRGLLLTLLLASLGEPGILSASEPDRRIAPQFQAFYEANGGLAIFGSPLSDELAAEGLPVQYFERARMEWHAEFGGTENEVLLSPLGREVIVGRTFPQSGPQPGQFHFVQTGHNLGGAFADYWFAHNGLRIFGYPLSDEVREHSAVDGQNYTVQYFERARMEWHPEQGRVLLAPLGARAYADFVGSPAVVPASAATLSPYEQQVHDQLAAARGAAGVAIPQLDPALIELARQRSADMANRGYFSHYTPEGETIFTLLNAAGISWSYAGEIIARNNYPDGQTASVAGNAFLASPPHRAVAVDPQYTAIGVGHAVDRSGMHYYTVIYVRR